MFDVYVNDKHDLLVVPQGSPLPVVGALGKWRKKKTRVISVSDGIRSAVQNHGDLAPRFYPVLSSPVPLNLPGWAVAATGAGAEPSA
ncbi:hypothetical protein QRQ56_39010 [Bradyrhizobium sp. U531]